MSQFSVTPVKGRHITTSLPFNNITMTGLVSVIEPIKQHTQVDTKANRISSNITILKKMLS